MLPGLLAGQEKMSKSDPNSAIFMEDDEVRSSLGSDSLLWLLSNLMAPAFMSRIEPVGSMGLHLWGC